MQRMGFLLGTCDTVLLPSVFCSVFYFTSFANMYQCERLNTLNIIVIVSLQLMGPHWSEAHLLHVGYVLEKLSVRRKPVHYFGPNLDDDKQ